MHFNIKVFPVAGNAYPKRGGKRHNLMRAVALGIGDIDSGASIAFYNLRKRELDEVLPWDFIDCGVSKTFLKREWQRALQEQTTQNCRMQCSGCGAAGFQGGVCVDAKTPSSTVTSASCQLYFKLLRFNCAFISSFTTLAFQGGVCVEHQN